MTDATRKDVLPLTADLTPAELAEALGALRFRGPSRCLVSLDKDVRDYLTSWLTARSSISWTPYDGALRPAANARSRRLTIVASRNERLVLTLGTKRRANCSGCPARPLP